MPQPALTPLFVRARRWEVVFVVQRLVITGFVQWISHAYLRLLTGMLVSSAYLIVMLAVKPHKRTDVGVMALATQSATVLSMYMATCISLFSSLSDADVLGLASEVLGFDSIGAFMATLIATSFLFLGCFLFFTIYQAAMGSRNLQYMRLRASGQPPDLALKDGKHFHLFLSHCWSSGQDQAANIKRKLQLVLPGCQIFLE